MLMNRKNENRIVAAFLGMVLILLLMTQNVHAAVAIETGADVSLKIEYKVPGSETKLPGAVFDIYKVAEVSRTVKFTKTEEFEQFPGIFDNLDQKEWEKSAKEAVEFLESHKEIKPFASEKTDQNGVIQFPGEGTKMTTGLYLVVGHECENGGKTYRCSPFFICLPNLEKTDQWNYHETAGPKATYDEENEVPKDSKLPQTGMLLWPIPVLAGTGLVFFMIGWVKRQKDEA